MIIRRLLAWLKAKIRMPSYAELIQYELNDAQLKLLTAQTGLEYAQAMVEYNTRRVERLKSLKGKQK